MGNALFYTLGGEGKPSTSTAADVEEYLLDSEDLIPQPQSRSKRERKKQAIKESQEGASQKVQLDCKIVLIYFTGQGHYVVFLGKTFYSHSASLHPGVSLFLAFS